MTETPHPHSCGKCPSYPCHKLIESSKTLSGGPLEITMRKMLENFTETVGCESFPKVPKEIVITKRSSDYHAQISGHPELWAAGKDFRHVVGDLVLTHKDEFGVRVIYPEAK